VSYPPKLLTDNESVRLDVHPHWSALEPVVLPPVLLAIITGFVAARSWLHGPTATIFLILWAAVLIHSAWRLASYYATDFVVTTTRIIFRRGLLARSDEEIPIDHVTNTSVARSFVDRFMGNGTLIVESNAKDGQARFRDIAHVEMVQRLINEVMADRSAPPSQATPPAGDVAGQLERLSTLHANGKLTDDEFASAKKSLLG
jgi:uncharacterized membrane protein YdbT with pleckstrin-like domain